MPLSQLSSEIKERVLTMPDSFTSWHEIVLPLISAILWMYVPGLLLGRSWRFRGFFLWGVAPLISVAFTSLTAILFPLIGVQWSPISVLLALVATGLLFAWRPSVWRKAPSTRSQVTFSSLGILTIAGTIVAVAITARLFHGFKFPSAYSQTFDGTFHVNVVQWFAQRGNGSSLQMEIVPGATNFYPAAFHDLTSLVFMTSGGNVAMAVNSTVTVVASLVWPGSLALLVYVLSHSNIFQTSAAFLLSGTFAQFPYLFVYFGVLYPNLLAYAILPVAAAVLIAALRIHEYSLPWEVYLVLMLTFPALALSQPNTLFLYVLVAAPFLIFWAWRDAPTLLRLPSGSRVRYIVGTGLTCLIAIAYYVMNRITLLPGTKLAEMRTVDTDWQPQGTKWDGLWRILTFNVGSYIESPGVLWGGLLLGLLTLAGAVFCLTTSGLRFLPFSYAVLGFLALTAYAMDFPQRTYVIGLWYSDSQRLYAALPLLAAPLAAVGLTRIISGIVTTFSCLANLSAYQRFVAYFILLSVTISLLFADSLARSSHGLAVSYNLPDSNSNPHYFLSREEYELLIRLPQHLDSNEAVLGDPWNGSSFSWAISGRRAVFPQPALRYADGADEVIVASQLRNLAENSDVCPALNRLNAHYVLDFGTDFILWEGFVNGENQFFSGLENLDEVPGFELIDQEGNARLYEVTGCQR